ncbi:MAG: hypothetical protein HGA45_32280 [Chloroflexales bacterium]|nr:hypothetical protein [Chloroflexales bacterium]
MGSWSDLDAVYPPGALTPATALVAALGHLAGATSVYQGGRPAGWLPAGLAFDSDLLARAERYLNQVPLDQLLAEACALLTPRQKLAVALILIDRQIAAGDAPAPRALAGRIIAGIGADTDQLEGHRRTLALKNDLSIFPQ